MFKLSEEQYDKLDEWYAGLGPEKYAGAIGGRLTYSFTPTTIGCVVKVYDSLTKQEINLTDYNNW